MSWTTDKTSLVGILNAEGYRELEFNLNQEEEAPFTYSDKSFTLRPVGAQRSSVVNNKYVGATIAELRVCYSNIDSAQFDANYELWIDLLDSLAVYLKGYMNDPTFLPDGGDNNFVYGTVTFYIGENQC